MKNLLRYLAFALMVGGAYAQSNLPACQTGSHFNNCFGTEIYGSGSKYIGEFRDGNYHGNGTLYDRNGLAIKSGNWADGELKTTSHILIENLKKEPSQTLFNLSSNNSLPTCRAGSHFKDCFGTEIYASGNKYVGGFGDGNYQGGGTLFAPDGSIIKSGIWNDGELRIPTQLLQVNQTNTELEKLRLEAEESKRKQVELEAQLRLAQQSVTQQPSQSNTSSRNSKRIALVIGNANYRSLPLKNPLNDASDISAALKQSGFEVLDLRNATLQEMTKGVREFGDRLLKSDVGW